MNFAELQKIDCSKYIEKKGRFSYLSWPYMVRQLRTIEPKATIHARINTTGLPYFKDESGGLVETYIMLDGKEVWNEWLPIMDNKNQSLKNPDTMAINKAIQRCKAKCISEYTGIGLYIYMGEDLPEAEPVQPKQITIGQDNVNWLVGFCKRHELLDAKAKTDLQDYYKFDPYKTTLSEFLAIKTKIENDYNEAA